MYTKKVSHASFKRFERYENVLPGQVNMVLFSSQMPAYSRKILSACYFASLDFNSICMYRRRQWHKACYTWRAAYLCAPRLQWPMPVDTKGPRNKSSSIIKLPCRATVPLRSRDRNSLRKRSHCKKIQQKGRKSVLHRSRTSSLTSLFSGASCRFLSVDRPSRLQRHWISSRRIHAASRPVERHRRPRPRLRSSFCFRSIPWLSRQLAFSRISHLDSSILWFRAN